MNDSLEINGRTLCPIKEAARLVTYSRDYVTRLAREGKIVASHIGRKWYVDLDSLNNYIKVTNFELEVRKKQLSAERKRERQIKKIVNDQRTPWQKKTKFIQVKSVAMASLALGLGLLSAVPIQNFISPVGQLLTQTTNTSQSQLSQSIKIDSVTYVVTTELPVAGQENKNNISGQVASEVRSLGDVQNGILLLPSVSSTTNVSDLFSDEVEIRKLADGTEVVVQVDEAGNTVGNEIPFVTVPVKRSPQI